MQAYIVIGGLGLIALSVLWRGYVLSILWAWFIPGIFGLPLLSVAQAIGLALVGSALTHRFIKNDAKGFEPLLDVFMAPAVMLIAGWLVKGFL